jgi:hypothetical protein
MDQQRVHDRPMKVYLIYFYLGDKIDKVKVALIVKKQDILLNNVQTIQTKIKKMAKKNKEVEKNINDQNMNYKNLTEEENEIIKSEEESEVIHIEIDMNKDEDHHRVHTLHIQNGVEDKEEIELNKDQDPNLDLDLIQILIMVVEEEEDIIVEDVLLFLFLRTLSKRWKQRKS